MVSTSLASLSLGTVSVTLADRQCSTNLRLTSWIRASIISNLDKKPGVSVKLLPWLGILQESPDIAGERKEDIIIEEDVWSHLNKRDIRLNVAV